MQKKLKKNDVFLLFRGYHGLKRKKVYRKVAKKQIRSSNKVSFGKRRGFEVLDDDMAKDGKADSGLV